MARRTVGFLATQFDESYQYLVWNGAAEEALALGLPLVFYEGTNNENQGIIGNLDNLAFSLAAKNRLDGLIVMSNAMGASLPHRRIAQFLRSFEHIPLVSIGVEFPGIPSVCAENEGGIRTMTEHLARDHGRRRFLFLAGQRGHPEGEIRKKEFLETHRRLFPDESPPKHLYGDFIEARAYRQILRLVDSGWIYDAVVAANDQMALGAVRALEERGIAVPRDVSVTGYDNIEDSIFSVPPLTTIRQPTGELGRRAVRRIAAHLGLISDEDPQEDFASVCVFRESCGCAVPAEPEADDNSTEGRLRYQVSQRAATETRFRTLRKIESSLIASFSIEDILKEVAKGTRQLGIRFCALVAFEAPSGNLDWSRLMLRSDEAGSRILAPYGLRFRTTELLPGGLDDSLATFVCEPLQFADERLGYLVCSADSPDRHLYAALRDQVSTALKGALLMAAERDREQALEQEVQRRTAELSLANKRLKDEIHQRKLLERELLDISNNIMGRIGRDIHDDLCQDIAGIGILAATLEGGLRRDGSGGAELAGRIARTAAETALHAKLIARDLFPAELEENGMVRALENLAGSKGGPTRPRIVLDLHADYPIKDPEKALHLYRIVQEALNNALRHSGATTVRIGLYVDRETATVEVADDGAGMGPDSGEGSGMGLKILKYRANVIGGRLRIQTDEGGTIISCRVAR